MAKDLISIETARISATSTSPGASEQKKKPHDHPRPFSVMSNANNKMLCLVECAIRVFYLYLTGLSIERGLYGRRCQFQGGVARMLALPLI